MKRFFIICILILLVTTVYADKISKQIEKKNYSNIKTYNWEETASKFIKDDGKDGRSVPGVIDYQGKITDSANNPITISVSLTFAIYNVSTGGSILWTETHPSVTPVDGLVHVLLGSQTTFGATLFNGSDLWLEINVDGDGEMTPRLRIASVPYAIYANDSDNLDGHDSSYFMTTTIDNWVDTTGDTMTGDLIVNADINISTGNAYKINGNNFINSPGTYNTLIGQSASGITTVDGGYNVMVGANAGLNNNGGNNIFLGYRAGYQESGSNKLYIANSWDTSPLIYGEFDIDFVKINGNFQTTGELRDSDNQPGTNGQVLSSTGTATNWVDTPSTGATEIDDLTDAKADGSSVFLGSLAGRVDDGSNSNVSLGNDSSYNNVDGTNNVCIGNVAGFNGTSYNKNTYVGHSAGYSNQGDNNTFIGYRAGSANQNTSNSIFIGFDAGNYNSPGSNILFIENSNSTTPLIKGDFTDGSEYVKIHGDFWATGITRDSGGNAGTSGQVLSTTGASTDWINAGASEINDLTDAKTDTTSVFLGSDAGANDDGTDNHNVAIGIDALKANTAGINNTSIGYQSLYKNVSGNHNCAYGYRALYKNTGNYNTANGLFALRENTGNNNTALGTYALQYNTTGSSNIGIGNNANNYNQEGLMNTIIGVGAGSGTSLHNKSGNVFLGYNAGYSETGDNKLYIDNSGSSTPLIGGDFTNGYEIVKINGDFETTGTTTIGDVLHLTPMSSAPSTHSNGDIYVSTDGHIYCYLGSWKQLD